MGSRQCGRCRMGVVMAVVVLLVAAMYPQKCLAQNLNDAVAYLDNVEKEVMRIAATASKNFAATCALVASCGSSCSRKACQPLQGDIDQLTCKAVALNPSCNGPNGTLGCSQLRVTLAKSFVRLPTSSNVTLIEAANYTICSQRMLDPTFQDISKGHNSDLNLTSWTYFGSVEGVERSFPGRDVPVNNCTFEPRKRPWYVGATAVKKDLVILLDAGNSMGDNLPGDIFTPGNKFQAAVDTIKELLDTLTYGDRVSVVQFTSASIPTLVGQTVTATTNASDLQPLKDALDALSVDTNQGASNLGSAFRAANLTFAPNANVLKIIMVITDGQYADATLLTTTKPVLDPLVAQKVLVLLYSFDRTAPASAALSQVACYLNGTYERIQKTVLNPLWTLRSYFGIVAFWRLKAVGFTPYWSKPYLDNGSLGMVITVAYPAFAADNYTLIGVAGSDVLMTELGSISVNGFSTALIGRASADPNGISVVPSALPCNVQLSTLNQCPSVVAPANPLCLSNDTSNTSFEERVCNCPPQCQAPPLASGTTIPVVLVAAAGGGGAILLLLLAAIIFYCCCKSKEPKVENQASNVASERSMRSAKSAKSVKLSGKTRNTTTDENAERPSYPTGSSSDGSRPTPRGSKSVKAAAWPVGNQSVNRDLTCFSHQQLEEATDYWADDAIVGQGACGNVYCGKLDGVIMAIKKPHAEVEVAKSTFDRELELLSKLNHRCLVRLLGYCEDDRILVYEFMVNGTLEDCLHRNHLGRHLSWEERLKIAVGASKGLEYLHDYATTKIIHGDVKPANILLDERLDAHISDFGLSLWSHNQDTSCLWASRMGGTPGYFDPEFASLGAFTPGSDVYSFGIVLLEILSGRKVVQESKNITNWAAQLYEQDASAILDPNLEPPPGVEAFQGVIKMALQCVQAENRYRPRMKDVAAFLDGVLSDWQKSKLDASSIARRHPSRRHHPGPRPSSQTGSPDEEYYPPA